MRLGFEGPLVQAISRILNTLPDFCETILAAFATALVAALSGLSRIADALTTRLIRRIHAPIASPAPAEDRSVPPPNLSILNAYN